MTVTSSSAPALLAERIADAAAAAAGLIPSPEMLVPGQPVPAASVVSSGWTLGAVALVDAASDSHLGVLVHPDLGDALASAPSGGLDLGSAVQPALDAAAVALGVAAGPGKTLAGAALADMVARATIAVPLVAGGEVAAVVFLVTPADVTVSSPVAAPVPTPVAAPARGVEMLHGVAMEVTVELGRTRLSVRELLALSPGDVLELDRAAGSPADLLVNGRLIARGEVVVVDEDFALRVTEIVAQSAAV
ncbi:MAG: flagellar motor switch protein FliN [Nocardioides sp.]